MTTTEPSEDTSPRTRSGWASLSGLVDLLLSPHGTRGKPRLLLGVVAVVGCLGAVPLWHVWTRGYWGVVGEDRLAELLTFAAYLPVVWLGIVVARKLHRAGLRLEAALWVLVAVGALVVAGEEVSWGQRQLGFAGPAELVDRNLQGEANIHNLFGLYALHTAYIIVSAYGMFLARLVVPRVARLKERPWLLVPQRDLALWFGICFAYYLWNTYLDGPLVALFGSSVDSEVLTGPKLQESAELGLAIGVLLFAARLARRERPDMAPAADPA